MDLDRRPHRVTRRLHLELPGTIFVHGRVYAYRRGNRIHLRNADRTVSERAAWTTGVGSPPSTIGSSTSLALSPLASSSSLSTESDGRGARDLVQVMALLLGAQDIIQVNLDLARNRRRVGHVHHDVHEHVRRARFAPHASLIHTTNHAPSKSGSGVCKLPAAHAP